MRNRLLRSAALALLVVILPPPATGLQPPPPPQPPGQFQQPVVGGAQMESDAQARMRGPVHEAFAEPVSANPAAGPLVSRQPPEPIDETAPPGPPAKAGEQAEWIPGYWGWDDDQSGFIWVSGTWRYPPPGMRWVPGYWVQAENGYRWVAGAWLREDVQQVAYLPAPPPAREEAAPAQPPGADQAWIPGAWVYQNNNYVWRPGFFAQSQANWVWTPASYSWTPRGVVSLAGYWDYPIQERGVLFAPAALEAQPGVRVAYTPTVVVDVANVLPHWFVRPSYSHYYFGNYYDDRYVRNGWFPWASYGALRGGYDPLYSWYSVRQPAMLAQFRERHGYYAQNVAARPPVAWNEHRTFAARAAPGIEGAVAFGRPVREFNWAGERRPGGVVEVGRGYRDLTARRIEAERVVAGVRVEPGPRAALVLPERRIPPGQVRRVRAPELIERGGPERRGRRD